jgi:hypothetical protein
VEYITDLSVVLLEGWSGGWMNDAALPVVFEQTGSAKMSKDSHL